MHRYFIFLGLIVGLIAFAVVLTRFWVTPSCVLPPVAQRALALEREKWDQALELAETSAQRAEFARVAPAALRIRRIELEAQHCAPALSVQLLRIHPRLPLGALIVQVVLALGLYFSPTLLAMRQRHRYRGAIFAINLLAGWTIIGWAGTLIWVLFL